MSTPRSHPKTRRLAVWLFALALAACGNAENEALEQARWGIQSGDLATAERVLQGLSGNRVEAMRAKIAAAAARRGELERSLFAIRDGALEHGAGWVRLELAGLLKDEHDPRNVELIEQAQSDLASLLALNRRPALRAGENESIEEHGAEPASSAAPGEGGSLALAALAEARQAQMREQWKTALALAAGAEHDSAAAADARLVMESIRSAARVDAEAVLGRARGIERANGAAEASRILAAELARFPATAEFDSLRFEAQLLASRAAALRASGPSGPARPKNASNSDGRGRAAAHDRDAARGHDALLAKAASAFECAAIAQSESAAGELAAAYDAWLEAARRKPESPWREECERRARECDLRLALRAELADFARLDEQTAHLLGWKTAADDAGSPKFESIPLAELSRALERARVSKRARLGWWIESIARGDEAERALALEGLGLCVERKEIEADHASSLVAQAKGEIAEGGWVFQGGRWLSGSVARTESGAAAEAARVAKNAQLVGEFRRSNAHERDPLLARILAAGDPALVSQALAMRWQDDWEKLERNPNLRQLAALADDRRELDAARAKALELIFDEQRYFYPYNPPECPPEKAAKYAAVQREVDERVESVRQAWEGSKRVKLGEGLRQLLAAAEWTSMRAEEAQVELAPAPEEWRFVFALPAEGEVGLNRFAWDPTERAALDESERIEARNERLWAALAGAKPADDVPGTDEQNQVRVTNEYRRMLGRRALAWNPRIEAAAQGHSDHMANTGEFSHFENGDPARRTPFDRLRLAGYAQGVSENISMGRGDPKSAHEGWTHSSGHHRNLLMRDHREMASAIASSYWTQNFGVDTAFQADL